MERGRQAPHLTGSELKLRGAVARSRLEGLRLTSRMRIRQLPAVPANDFARRGI